MGILNDHDPVETQNGSIRCARFCNTPDRSAPSILACCGRGTAPGTMRPSATTPYRLITPEQEAKSPSNRDLEHRSTRRSAIGGDHPAGEQGVVGAGRSHRELPILGAALRHRLRALLACPDRSAWRRPDLRSGSRVAGHLRARIRRRPADRAATPRLSPGKRRQGHSLVSASMADARAGNSRRCRWASVR